MKSQVRKIRFKQKRKDTGGKKCRIRECPLFKKIEVPYGGNKKAKVVFIGESPGYNEEVEGKPFVGAAGDMIKECAEEAGLVFSRFYVMNSARCRIDKSKMSGKEITSALSFCREYVTRTIEILKPKLIIASGDFALRQILRKSGITKARGRYEFSKEFDCYVMPCFHPAYILRNRSLKPLLVEDLKTVKRFMRNNYTPPEDSRVTHYQEVDSIQFLIDQKKPVALDTEGQGLDWLDPNYIMISLSLSDKSGSGYDFVLFEEVGAGDSWDYTFKWNRIPPGKKKRQLVDVYVKRVEDFERKLDEIEALLADENIRIYTHNGSFDFHCIETTFARERGYLPKIEGWVIDTQAASHLIDENLFKMSRLDELQKFYSNIKNEYNIEFEKKYDKADMLSVPRESRTDYAAQDADVTYQVTQGLKKELAKNPKYVNYLVKFIMPTLKSLMMLESNGCPIDRAALPEVAEEVRIEMLKHQRKALMTVPKKVLHRDDHRKKNIAKNKKDGIVLTRSELVRDILFDPQGFRLKSIKKTKSGLPAADKAVRKELLDGRLTKNAERFLTEFGEFKELHTLWSRYLNGFDQHIRHDGKIHSKFSLVVAVTGRIASSDPNMMNNPKRSKSAKKIRRLISAPPGWLLLEVDESQSELRWASHVSLDRNMIRIFRDASLDIHTETAKSLSPKPFDELDKFEKWKARRDAKSVNFGLLFRMTVAGFIRYAKEEYGIDLEYEQAEDWVNIFFGKYPGLERYHEEIVEFCRQKGYVESVFGRRRHLPEIHSNDKGVRWEAERQAINHPIQSPSSDTVLIALNESRKKEIFDPDYFFPVLFIHDSLVFLIKDCSRVTDYAGAIINEMENPPLKRDFGVELVVPLKAEAEIGQNLAEMEELKI
jgi:uracil-DNA glycosylase family 4